MARVLAQYLIDKELPFLGFDTDRSHGALMRFYPAYASPVAIDKVESLDAIVEAAVDQPGRRILVDLAAQTHDPLATWMEDAGVIGLADELGMKLFYWHVMDSGKDSVDLLRRLLDRFGTGLALRARSQPGARRRLRRPRAVGRAGARDRAWVRTSSRSRSSTSTRSRRSTAPAAPSGRRRPADRDPTGLGLMDRQRVKMWLRDVYREIDEVGV